MKENVNISDGAQSYQNLRIMGGKSSKDSLSEEDLNLLVSSTNISAEEIQVII